MRIVAAVRVHLLLAVALAPGAARSLHAQSEGGTVSSTVAGAALGLYSGATLGLVGSVLPCGSTLSGPACAAAGAGVGGGVGLAMGGLLGSRSAEGVRGRRESATYGVAVGAAVGVVMRSAVRQYGWADAVAFAAIGGAVGAVPRGTLVGMGVGATLGGLAWLVSPAAGLPDLATLTLVLGALGGLIDWADGAVGAGRAGGAAVVSTFSIGLR